MSHDVDDDLRRLFDKSASTIGTISPGFTDTVLTEGARRRRIRRVTAAGGAAAAVLLVSGALWQVPDLVDNSSPILPANPSGVTLPTTQDVDTRFASNAEWAASLPRGENVRAAFAVKQTLYAGDVSVPITSPYVKPSPRSMVTVCGPAADGWLATVLNYGERGGVQSQTGIIAQDGRFTPFAGQPDVGCSPFPLAVSPDRTRFAVGSDIRDVETGDLVTSFPHPDAFADAWLDDGIVYLATGVKVSDTRMWIWQPGSEPEETLLFELASTHGGIVVTTDGDCAVVGPLSEPPSTYQRICDLVVSISPHGERVFTESFMVVDVASGDATTLPVPYQPRTASLPLTTFWEDEDHLVMLIPGENPKIFGFVRCEISTNTCERASDELHGDDPSDAPMELSPLD